MPAIAAFSHGNRRVARIGLDVPHAFAHVVTRRALLSVVDPAELGRELLDLVGSPNVGSRAWVWRQYDQIVRGGTMVRPGSDAAVVRVNDAGKALALKTDCTPRYVHADPEMGGMQAVAERGFTILVDARRDPGQLFDQLVLIEKVLLQSSKHSKKQPKPI